MIGILRLRAPQIAPEMFTRLDPKVGQRTYALRNIHT
jgi:hypothetical protein